MDGTRRPRIRKDLIVFVIVMMLAVGFNMYFTVRVAKQYNQQWCDLLVPLDDRNQKLPRSENEDDNVFRDRIHGLRVSFDC